MNYLCDGYVQASRFEKPEVFQSFPKGYLVALNSIKGLPPQEMPEEQVARIAHRLCRILLYYPHRTFDIFEQHMNLLSTVLPRLSDPLKSFLDARAEANESKTQNLSQSLILRLAYGLRDSAVDDISFAVVQALRQITHRVMR